jgi:DNA-binding ferritin-like protein
MSEYPAGLTDEYEHIEVIAAAVSELGGSIRHDIAVASRLGDDVTADLLTTAAGTLDKTLWFLESHIYPLSGERAITERLRTPRSLGVTNTVSRDH